MRKMVGLAGLAVMLLSVACGAAATADFIVASSLALKHSHEVLISGANVDNPPATPTVTRTLSASRNRWLIRRLPISDGAA